jgi:hypothetical protein
MVYFLWYDNNKYRIFDSGTSIILHESIVLYNGNVKDVDRYEVSISYSI